MKKIILLSLLISSYFLNAQNWMPINVNKSRIHYLSKDSIAVFYGYTQPILSVVATNKSQTSNGVELNFKRGYNYQVQNRILQYTKAKMFGDSLYSTNTQSNFFTSDTSGFNISFPHQYSLYDSIIIGISNRATIVGRVDSLYRITRNGIVDSIVFVNQSVYDSNGSINTSHPFNNTYYLLSKKFGILESINYSELAVASYYEQLFINDTIHENKNYFHQVGDEFLINENSILFGISDWSSHFFRVNSISYQNSNKTINYKTYERNYKPWLPIPPFVYMGISSVTIDTNKIFDVIESNVIEDSCLQWPIVLCYSPYYEYSISKGILNRSEVTSHEVPYINYSGANIIVYPNTIYTGGGQLSSTYVNRKIGVWDESHQRGIGGIGNDRITNTLVYAKIGGKTWGTPFSLITSIDKLDIEKRTTLYPNPTSTQLNIETMNRFENIEIRNLRGQLVLEQTFNNQIDISNIPVGVYFIKLIGEKSITEKFIKD